MKKPNRTKEERETGIIFNEQDQDAILWSVSPSAQRKFARKLGPGSAKGVGGCLEWKFPKDWVKITKRRVPRVLTAEQREALVAKMRKVRP